MDRNTIARLHREMQELHTNFTRSQVVFDDGKRKTIFVWIHADAERRYNQLQKQVEKEGMNGRTG